MSNNDSNKPADKPKKPFAFVKSEKIELDQEPTQCYESVSFDPKAYMEKAGIPNINAKNTLVDFELSPAPSPEEKVLEINIEKVSGDSPLETTDISQLDLALLLLKKLEAVLKQKNIPMLQGIIAELVSLDPLNLAIHIRVKELLLKEGIPALALDRLKHIISTLFEQKQYVLSEHYIHEVLSLEPGNLFALEMINKLVHRSF